MNKTLSIGLAGFSFVIEEHAYIKLSDYLTALRNSLDASEADEVMHDIEIRMVEIFRDSLGKREVINDADVEKVIAQIGTPEAIEEQEEAYFSESNSGKQQKTAGSYNVNKQLFRDPENAKLGGVCSGLAHYVGIDVSLMRAIWLGVSILGIFTAHISTMLIILIYIILWAVLPVAKTASDFLKMKGKPVNFDTLKEESGKIVQFANESTQKVGEMYNESKPYINNAGNGIWNVIRYILGAIFAFLAFIFLTGSFVGFGIFADTDLPGLNEMNFYLDSGNMNYVLSAMIVLGSLIPALLFGLLAVKLISPKTKLRNTGYVLGALFIALIALSTYFGISMAKKNMIYKGDKEDTEEMAINTISDTVFVDVKQVSIPQNFTAYDHDIYSDKKSIYDEDYIEVDVTRKADVKTPYLIIKKHADGYNIPLELSVPVEVVGNKVLLPNYIKYPYQHRFRHYRVDYELVVPANTIVIPLKKDDIDISGDLNGNGINDDDEDDDDTAALNIDKNKITINGNTYEYMKDNDSVIVNGKKVSKAVADKMLDSTKNKIEKIKGIDIKVDDGKNEVSIKTK